MESVTLVSATHQLILKTTDLWYLLLLNYGDCHNVLIAKMLMILTLRILKIQFSRSHIEKQLIGL